MSQNLPISFKQYFFVPDFLAFFGKVEVSKLLSASIASHTRERTFLSCTHAILKKKIKKLLNLPLKLYE